MRMHISIYRMNLQLSFVCSHLHVIHKKDLDLMARNKLLFHAQKLPFHSLLFRAGCSIFDAPEILMKTIYSRHLPDHVFPNAF